MPRSFSSGSALSALSPPPLAPFGASFASVIVTTRQWPCPGRAPAAAVSRHPAEHIRAPPLPPLPPVRGRHNLVAPTPAGGVFLGSDDHWMPSAVQRAAPAIAQMAEAGSKPSLTTVVSMLALVTHTGVSRDAGSVMVESAGSTVEPFSRPAGGLSPASRIVAMATASWASL